jgi:hypothetical protein
MADKLTQRLIAAGASPQRAAAFTKQFAASRPGVKPQKLEDAFDAELGAIALSIWPNTFRPPSIDDPEIDDYIIGAYGEDKLNNIVEKAWSTSAPTFKKSIAGLSSGQDKTGLNIDQYIAYELYYGGKTAGQIQNELQTQEGLAFTGNLLPSDVNARVTKLSNELNNVSKTESDLKFKFLQGDNGDKYYKAGLPTPKLKYGKTTNLKAGIIGIDTLPGVPKFIEEQAPIEFAKVESQRPAVQEQMPFIAAARQANPISIPPSGYMDPTFKNTEDMAKETVANKLLGRLNEKKQTPFFDEVKRRESVKGKTIK